MVTSLGVINKVLSSIRARRWDMGILRAMGVTRFGLFRLIIAKALLAGIVACVLSLQFGVMAGYCGTGVTLYINIRSGQITPLIVPWAKIVGRLRDHAWLVPACCPLARYYDRSHGAAQAASGRANCYLIARAGMPLRGTCKHSVGLRRSSLRPIRFVLRPVDWIAVPSCETDEGFQAPQPKLLSGVF